MHKEEWRDIKNYEGLYAVSSFGRVKSLRKDLVMSTRRTNASGYPVVELWKDRIERELVVHRLVAETFIENPENKPMVNHLDGNKTNNNLYNLEWVTASENVSHAIAMGLMIPKPTKLTTKEIAQIRSEYRGFRATMAEKYSVSTTTIDHIIKTKRPPFRKNGKSLN